MKHLKVFTSPTCAPCKVLKPMLADLKMLVVEVDIEASPSIAAMHHVRTVPTLKLYDDDMLVKSHTGACTKQFLQEFVS
jgi:thioredoxin-like negative regulator of GroEL